MNEEMLLTNIYVRSRVFSGLIHSACGLSCWCFSVTGEKLFFSTCPDEQEFLLFLRSSGCLDYATGEQVRRDRPVILSDSIGIIWGAEYMWKNGAPEELIMIGPIFNSSSSFRSIETALHRLTLSQQARNMLLEKNEKDTRAVHGKLRPVCADAALHAVPGGDSASGIPVPNRD